MSTIWLVLSYRLSIDLCPFISITNDRFKLYDLWYQNDTITYCYFSYKHVYKLLCLQTINEIYEHKLSFFFQMPGNHPTALEMNIILKPLALLSSIAPNFAIQHENHKLGLIFQSGYSNTVDGLLAVKINTIEGSYRETTVLETVNHSINMLRQIRSPQILE